MIKMYRADDFREFCKDNPVDYDRTTGIAWFSPENGMKRCIDRVSLHNNQQRGGQDDVNMVLAETSHEAADELERIRPR